MAPMAFGGGAQRLWRLAFAAAATGGSRACCPDLSRMRGSRKSFPNIGIGAWSLLQPPLLPAIVVASVFWLIASRIPPALSHSRPSLGLFGGSIGVSFGDVSSKIVSLKLLSRCARVGPGQAEGMPGTSDGWQLLGSPCNQSLNKYVNPSKSEHTMGQRLGEFYFRLNSRRPLCRRRLLDDWP